jgi:hypothetical protein
MWRAGTPATIDLDATSRVTTEPAPTIAKSPMVTPGRIRAPEPIKTREPIMTGFRSPPCSFIGIVKELYI